MAERRVDRPDAVVGIAFFTVAAVLSALLAPSEAPPWHAGGYLIACALIGMAAGLLAARGAPGTAARSADEEAPGPRPAALDRLQVEARGRRLLLATRTIDWVEAEGNYVRLHTESGPYLHRSSLSDLAAGLDPSLFLRVHRSAVVNLDAVQAVEPMSTGDATLTLRSGVQVRMSRRYAAAFNERTGRG